MLEGRHQSARIAVQLDTYVLADSRSAEIMLGRWMREIPRAQLQKCKGHADAVSGVNAARPTRRPTSRDR